MDVTSHSSRIILVADAHIDAAANTRHPFFQMLDWIATTDHNVVFLGDIFDLWIGFARYEQPAHTAFLAWCKEQQTVRTVGFIEGNHEYFITPQYRRFFTWATDDAWFDTVSKTHFCHGDQVNRHDRNYLRFRQLMRNRVTRTLVCFLPFGKTISRRLKKDLKKTNAAFRKHLPEAEIIHFADHRVPEDTKSIFIGHFHRDYACRTPSGRVIHIVPSWEDQGKIQIYDPAERITRIRCWQEAAASD